MTVRDAHPVGRMQPRPARRQSSECMAGSRLHDGIGRSPRRSWYEVRRLRRSRGPARRGPLGLTRSEASDVGGGLGEVLRCLLRHVVSDAFQHAVRVWAREPLRVRLSFGGRLVEVARDRDRERGDRGSLEEPLLEAVVLRLALGEAQSPAVVVDDNGDVIGVLEGLGGAAVRGVATTPFSRRFSSRSCLSSRSSLTSRLIARCVLPTPGGRGGRRSPCARGSPACAACRAAPA